MTSKKESATNTKVDEKVETENINDQGEEFQTASMTSSDKATSAASAYSLTSMLLALIVAIPTAAIVAYVAVPYELNEILSTESHLSASNGHVQAQMPAAPSMEGWNTAQQPEWVTKQNAAMEQRRAEFKKRNADNRANSNAEAPQWVKDHQALMEKEQAKHQQWAKKSADMARNRAMASTGYGQQPAMGGYQQNPAPYYNGPAYPVNPNYNRPYYPNGPYNAPYGYPQR